MWLYSISDIQISRNGFVVKKNQPVTVQSLEAQLALTRYNCEYVFKFTSADGVFIPSMAIPFYHFIFELGRVPNEQEFYAHFTKLYCSPFRITENDYSYLNQLYVKEIIHRSYPSFVRDFHFYLLLSEDVFFDNVWYSVKSDVADGIDIFVKKDEVVYTIGIFLESAKSRHYLDKKISSVQIPIAVSYSKDSTKQIGKFSLCHQDHIDIVKTAISSPLSKW